MKKRFLFLAILFGSLLVLSNYFLQLNKKAESSVAVSYKKEAVLNEKTVDLSSLKLGLETQIASYKGEVSFALIDLKSGKSIGVKADESFYPASSIKILLLISVLRDVQNGKYSLASVEPTILNMMTVSSNYAANALISKTGFDNTSQTTSDAGLYNTVFIHGFSDGNTNVPRARIGSNSMSVGDAALLWQKIYQKDLLNDEMTKKALEYAKLPNVKLIYSDKEASVYHKPGYIGTLDAETYIDSGVVETGSFAYAVSYFSRKNPSHQQGADFGQQLTKTVFDWFGENY